MPDSEPANGSEPADNRTAFDRFESFTKRIVRVPKSEIDAQRKKDETARRARLARQERS